MLKTIVKNTTMYSGSETAVRDKYVQTVQSGIAAQVRERGNTEDSWTREVLEPLSFCTVAPLM